MADNRTMTELLRAPTEGYAEAIVVPPIVAEQFELKHNLINMMTSDQFFGLEKDNQHDHIRCLRNEILNFEQKFNESFHEAWDRYKDLLRACPHHGFTELHQLNTFYNALNPTDQDSLNAAAGGNLLETSTQDALTIIENKSKAVPSKPVTSEPANTPVSTSKPNPQASIPYPSRRNNERNREKAKDQIEKFYQIFKDMSFEVSFADDLILMPKFASTLKALIVNKEKLSEMARTLLNEHCSAVLLKKLPEKLGELTLRVGKEAITFNLDQTSRYSANYNDMTAKRINVIDMACEEYSQEVLGFSNTILSGNPTPFYDPIVSATSSTLTPFGDSDFFFRREGDILLLEAFLNDDPSPPPPNQRNYMPEVRKELKICEAKTKKSSIDEPPVVELKALPPHLEYAFLEGDDKLPVIIAKDLSVEEKAALITVLKSHKRAIAWKLSDIKGINPEFCNHKILLEEDFTPAVQHQRRVNPKIHDVIKQEVIKLLDAGLIYPISDSLWVSPVYCVPKKRGFTFVENEENKLIPTRLVTMLERLAGNQYYCFLDGFSGYFQIPIDPKDQEKTTFTCPYGTFAYRRMPLGYAMLPERFRVFGDSFQSCLSHLEKMLKRYEDTNLCLNWEKSHFMVKEGIVLGHKILKKGIEVDKAKIDVISKLPHPTTVKGIQNFLAHAGENGMSWSDKLDDALWAFRTAYKTPIECTPYKLFYEKACHLPVELEHKAYWALKHVNFDLKTAEDHRKIQINELNKLCDQAYENSLIYKEKPKRIHDSKIKNRVFNIGDRVLLFNSHLKIFSSKLKSCWSGSFTIS
nr:reverse transcriptase domain-containing protein [Tanacetum cinerariifolium]